MHRRMGQKAQENYSSFEPSSFYIRTGNKSYEEPNMRGAQLSNVTICSVVSIR